MSKCKKCSKHKCACTDSPLVTVPLDSALCPTPQVCSEFVYTGCIVYNGPEIPQFNLVPGMTLNEVLQHLIIAQTNPDCVDSTNACLSVSLTVVTITSTTIKLSWSLVGADGYILSYNGGSGATTVTLASTVSSYTITGLTANTEYTISVESDCSPGSCTSVEIIVKTKS